MSSKGILFEYTECKAIECVLTSGRWKLEVWGAASTSTSLGGYASGELLVKDSLKIYINLGSKGIAQVGSSEGGCNGGGRSVRLDRETFGGGGGSDIRAYISYKPDYYSLKDSTELFLTNTKLIIGNSSMPSPTTNSNITGNPGNGYARITHILSNVCSLNNYHDYRIAKSILIIIISTHQITY